MTSRFNRCIITGCGLHIPGQFLSFWGDLFEHGDMYILNGEPCTERYVVGQKCLTIGASGMDVYFERRGVVVVPKAFASLNQLAKEYLNV